MPYTSRKLEISPIREMAWPHPVGAMPEKPAPRPYWLLVFCYVGVESVGEIQGIYVEAGVDNSSVISYHSIVD